MSKKNTVQNEDHLGPSQRTTLAYLRKAKSGKTLEEISYSTTLEKAQVRGALRRLFAQDLLMRTDAKPFRWSVLPAEVSKQEIDNTVQSSSLTIAPSAVLPISEKSKVTTLETTFAHADENYAKDRVDHKVDEQVESPFLS